MWIFFSKWSERRISPITKSAIAQHTSVVEFVLNYATVTISSVTWSMHPSIKKSSLKIHRLVRACRAHMCAGFKARQLERESWCAWQRDLGRWSHCSLFLSCCVARMSHFWNKCLIMFSASCSVWFSNWARLLTINGMSTICQNTTKTSCYMEFGFWMRVEGFLVKACQRRS